MDYYKILGVSKDAQKSEIKEKFRTLAHKYHPDHNKEQNAEQKFKEVKEAYDVLYDDKKRKLYDNHGPSLKPQDFFRNSSYTNDFFKDFDNSFFFFNKNFQRRHNLNIKIHLMLTLEELVTNTQKTYYYVKKIICKKCSGTGKSNSEKKKNICTECNGKKIKEEQSGIVINIPLGIKPGQYIKINGYGHQDIQDNATGDLICVIKLVPHPIFELHDLDVVMHKNINFSEACLGSEIEVPTIYNENIKISIPPGTKSGQTFRIKGKGLPESDLNFTGDQYIVVDISVPNKLSPKAISLVKELENEIKKEQ